MNANWLMMSKMCQQSDMSELDVKLLFRKAQKTVKKAELKGREYSIRNLQSVLNSASNTSLKTELQKKLMMLRTMA